MWYIVSFMAGVICTFILSVSFKWVNTTNVTQSIKKLKDSVINDVKVTAIEKPKKKGFLWIGTGKNKRRKASDK